MGQRVSIIICTKNRAECLRKTLGSIARCNVPSNGAVELLIVDNGSTDQTRDIVKEANLGVIAKRHVFEEKPGKAHAYNRGFAEASGEVLLSTDDDVRVPPEWIERMSEPIRRGDADLVAGGVRLAPHLLKPWMTQLHKAALADSHDLDRSTPPLFIGANFAMSRDVLKRVPNFEIELGPGALGFFDDGFFAMRCDVAGFRIKYLLDVVVEHHPDPARINRHTLLQTAVSWGRTTAWTMHHWEHQRLSWPYLRRLNAILRRSVRTLIDGAHDDSAPSDAAWARAHAFGLCDQYLIERRRPCLYDRHGLQRRAV